MVKSLCAIVCVLVILMVASSQVAAVPAYRGYTGLILVPTADVLGAGSWDAGLFWEDVSEGTINDVVANFGVLPGLEVGLNRFKRDEPLFPGDSTDTETFVNGKYAILPETTSRPGLAAGIIDLTDMSETTVYIVGSKSLTSPWGTYNGEIIAPRLHVGFGGGYLSGLFAGASAYLGNRMQVIGEWDSRHVNAGAKFTLSRGLVVSASWIDLANKDNSSFGVGVSYNWAR